MNNLVKKIRLPLIATSMTLALTACGCISKINNKVTKSDNINPSVTAKKEKNYSLELAKYFPNVKGTVLNYSGAPQYAPYAHTITLSEIKKTSDILILSFKGKIIDKKTPTVLSHKYIINSDSIKKIQSNNPILFCESIIPERTVLKLPLKVNEIWSEKVQINNKEYTCDTKIISISKDKDNKNVLKTETIVKNIEDYPKKIHRESYTFKEGKGIIEFKTTFPFILTGHQKKETTAFNFQYHILENEIDK